MARSAPYPLLDLTESDPARCGLGWDPAEIGALLDDASSRAPAPDAPARARDAVASYLAGRGVAVDPDRIRFTRSRSSAHLFLAGALCGAGDEVLAPSPGHPFVDALAFTGSVRVLRYGLAYDGEWRVDLGSLERKLSRRTRAVLVGNPAEPTGASVSREDLAFLDALCADRGVALIGDETFADTLPADGSTSVLDAGSSVAFHLSGLSGVCGLRGLNVEWWAAGGPDDAVAAALARVEPALHAEEPVPSLALRALPALLARRERFLARLRARLAENRASLAAAALRESPWSLSWGRGGCWAVLEIGAAEREGPLCVALREHGVAVHPGSLYGLPDSGYLVVSLLLPPDAFAEALSRLERRLRAPL
jgi:alanine-synthesizing transaminase